MDLILLFKVINVLVECPKILQLIDFHIPHGNRLIQNIAKHHHHAAYIYHSTIPRLLRLGNAALLEYFGSSNHHFNRQAHSFVSELIRFVIFYLHIKVACVIVFKSLLQHTLFLVNLIAFNCSFFPFCPFVYYWFVV